VSSATDSPTMATVLAMLLACAATGALAKDAKPVRYTCADGTKLRAMFSPPGIGTGTVTLVYSGSTTELTLLQTVSADGGRYSHGDVEFWIKGNGATLARAGQTTTCQTSG
jgi:membrane-bound inhibitor of C-type lysozyme